MARGRRRARTAKVVVVRSSRKRAHVSRHIAPVGRLIRPRLYKLGRKISKSRRSGLGKGRITINPRRRKRHNAKRSLKFLRRLRRNPARRARGRRRNAFRGRARARRNPIRRGRSRRYTRRNPVMNIKAAFKQVLNKGWIMQLAIIGGGFVGGMVLKNVIAGFMNSNQTLNKYTKFAGIGNILVGSFLAISMKNAKLKQLGIVVAATGLYDVIFSNLNVGIPALPTVDVKQLGKPMAGSYMSSARAGYSGSYSVPRLPVSPVAAMNGSYSAPNMKTQGLGAMENPYAGIDW